MSNAMDELRDAFAALPSAEYAVNAQVTSALRVMALAQVAQAEEMRTANLIAAYDTDRFSHGETLDFKRQIRERLRD